MTDLLLWGCAWALVIGVIGTLLGPFFLWVH